MMFEPWKIVYEEAEAFLLKKIPPDKGKMFLAKIQSLLGMEVTVGAVGGFSSGKTTCINGMIGYPLLPVSIIPTTTTVCKIIFSRIPYLKVIWKDSKGVERCVVNYEGYMEPEIFDAYRLFFLCAANSSDKGGIGLRNGEYFRNSYGEIRMSDTDIRQGIMMALSYFGAYVEPNKQKTSIYALKKYMAEILWSGRIYMTDLMEGKHYRIEVGWPSPLLQGGLILMDIPGLSAASAAGSDGTNHDKIAFEALQNCHALMPVYRGQPMSRDVDAICETWLSKRLESQELMLGFIHVINFVDQMDDVKENLLSILGSIDAWAKKKHVDEGEVFGICALANSEKYYVEKAICEKEQISHKGRQFYDDKEATDFEALTWYLKELKTIYIMKLIWEKSSNGKMPKKLQELMEEMQKRKALTGNIRKK